MFTCVCDHMTFNLCIERAKMGRFQVLELTQKEHFYLDLIAVNYLLKNREARGKKDLFSNMCAE